MARESERFDAHAALVGRLRWLIGIRVLVVVTIAGTYAATTVGTEGLGWPEPVRNLVAGVSVLTLLFIALLRVLPWRFAVVQAHLQLIGDLALIAGFIHALGERGAGFSILYLVTISVASVLLQPASGLAIAGLAFLFHAVPLLGRQLGAQGAAGPVMNHGELAYNLFVHFGGFSAVALMAAYLARDTARAESALREKASDLNRLEALHRDVVSSLTSGLITTDSQGIVTSANRMAATILGRGRSMLIGQPVSASGLFDEEGWQRIAAEARSGDRREVGGDRIRHERQIHVAGRTVPVGFSVTLLRDQDENNRGFIVLFRDLTELHQLQEKVLTQDRMATLGAMAAGLAHEVGNPLAAISGSAQMLAPSFENDPARRRLLEITIRESERLDRTVKTFLALARPPERRPVCFDVANLLREQLALLGNSPELTSAHRLEVDLPDEPIALVADPDQISQVFWNVTRNALKAMADGGTLTVAGRLEGDRFTLSFADTGTGMTPEERLELFHPFSSFFDDGVGIGMAIVYRIVEQHDGDIEVESQPGQGSTIRIHLPRGETDRTARRDG